MTVARSDADLAASMALDSGAAFDLLFLRHSGAVRGVGLAMLRDPDVADDLVQEAFLQVWRHRARYAAGRGSVRTWILAIAHNRAVDQRRSRARYARIAEAVRHVAHIRDATADALTETIRRDEAVRVRAALARVPSAQRQALLLTFWGGLTQREVSVHTRVALGTAKSRIRLGGQSVARQMEAGDVDDTVA